MSARVGVIGLGAMGGAMAANLLARGDEVTGFDVEPERVADLVALGGSPASSAADAAAACDVLLLSLPSQEAFEAVAVADDGLLAGARDGLVVVETSTLAFEVKERARATLARHGVTLLDCPMSGTGDQAVGRDVVVLASGPEEVVRAVAPVFDGFARSHHYLGAFGNGTRTKLVANLLVAIHNAAAAEALNLAAAAGLDPAQTLEVVADGAGSSRMFEVRGPKMVARDYASGIRTRVFQKDLALIGEFAEAHDAATPLLGFCTWLYAATAEAGYADSDTAAVYEVLRRL